MSFVSNIASIIFKKISPLDLFFVAIICVFCYLVYFQGLSEYSVRMWDEARNGVNALEMLRNGNIIVTHFNGSPDLWNTKPPLFIWIIATSFKLFGVNEFSLRLPSAIAASLVALTMYLLASFWIKNKWIGILSVFILFSSFGFSDIHIGRSGDYDAVLTLFVFLATIFSFIFVQKWKPSYLYLAIAFWTFAVLTKGIAGILMLPGVFLYIILTGKLKQIVTLRAFWIGLLGFIFIIAAYYLSRNYMNPGFLLAVWKEEFYERTVMNNLSQGNSFLYYWNYLREFRFQHWIYFVPFSIIAFFLASSNRKYWILYSYTLSLSYFAIISTAQSKNIWYDAQLYPYMSLLVSIFLISILQKLPKIIWIIPIIILIFYNQRYVRTNLAYIQRPDLESSNSCLQYGYFLRENSFQQKGIVGVHGDPQFCMPFVFYMIKENIPMKELVNIEIGEKVLTCDSSIVASLNTQFKTSKSQDFTLDCGIWKVESEI